MLQKTTQHSENCGGGVIHWMQYKGASPIFIASLCIALKYWSELESDTLGTIQYKSASPILLHWVNCILLFTFRLQIDTLGAI